MYQALSRVIPPPKYITLPAVGIDISDTSLKYVSLKAQHGKKSPYQLKSWGEISIPSGVLKGGEIIDPRQLVAVLKECKNQTGAKFVRVTLPEERAYLFETEIKKTVSHKEITPLLEFRLEENVPIPPRDVFFDYTILPSTEQAKVSQVVVAAYAKQVIQSYYDACVEAGLYPTAFEIEAQSMARAVVPADASGAVMVVDFGKTRTGIGIVYKQTLLYTSTIDIGGYHLSQVLRKVLGDDVSEAELTRIKNTQGLIRGKDQSDIRDALMSTVSVIKDELLTRMQYWHLRSAGSDDRRISSVILTGGSANLRGIAEYLSETMSVPVSRANVWENVLSLDETIPPIDVWHSYGYAAAIGLALMNKL